MQRPGEKRAALELGVDSRGRGVAGIHGGYSPAFLLMFCHTNPVLSHFLIFHLKWCSKSTVILIDFIWPI